MRMCVRHALHCSQIDGGPRSSAQTSGPSGPRVHPSFVAEPPRRPRPRRLRSFKARPGLISTEVRLRPR